jgi:pimeloyl-ACP methyl ester carboxylesterase
LEFGIKAARKWSLVGQSYGGWVSFTYLSFYPEALHMVLVTGGIPPVGQETDKVYEKTYNTVIDACNDFYSKFSSHQGNVRCILDFIYTTPMKMPGGGILTPERFLCIGRMLGTTNGDKKVADALAMCMEDIHAGKLEFETKTLIAIESWLRFEERPLYAILQEPIYAEQPLPASNWSAMRVGQGRKEYWWLQKGAFDCVFSPKNREDEEYAAAHFDDKQIYFSAEHVYPFHYDQFKALGPLKDAADILAKKEDWPPLFDINQLRNNKVPVSALSYKQDMFINWELSDETVDKMGGQNIHHVIDKDLKHTAVKDQSEDVLPRLWNNLAEAAKGILRRGLTDEELESAASVTATLEEASEKWTW